MATITETDEIMIDNAPKEAEIRPGRPRFDIPSETLEYSILSGFTAREVAEEYGVSERTVRRQMHQNGLRKMDLYTPVTDEELDRIVTLAHRRHPNSGYKMIHSVLRGDGVHVPMLRLKESMRRVDAEGIEFRRLGLRTNRRRQYSVPGPNHLWHIDGHHKLIRWRFVVHGGVDGFSRLVVYLTVAGNNRAATVLKSFHEAVETYGLPSRVRSDKGGENMAVAEFMIHFRGTNRNSHITGRSVHNQRIERLWRDVYEHAIDLFYQTFMTLENNGTLDPDNEIHLFALHWIFLPQIQKHLESFRRGWNLHGIRTERNQSPLQLWTRYRDQSPSEGPVEVSADHGIDWNGPHNLDSTTVSVPEIQLSRQLTQEELASLPIPEGALDNAVGLYLQTVQVLSRITGA